MGRGESRSRLWGAGDSAVCGGAREARERRSGESSIKAVVAKALEG
jgi:hypothetical protein